MLVLFGRSEKKSENFGPSGTRKCINTECDEIRIGKELEKYKISNK